MTEEMFEVFQEDNDHVIAVQPRSVVHRQGLLHRAVNVIVVDSQGRILLQRRASHKDVCPDLWDLSCAEHLKPGESYLDGALRGLREELGLEVKRLERLRKAQLFCYQNEILGLQDNEFTECWLAPLPEDATITINHAEVAEVGFHSAETIVTSLEKYDHASGLPRSPLPGPGDFCFTPWAVPDLQDFVSLSVGETSS